MRREIEKWRPVSSRPVLCETLEISPEGGVMSQHPSLKSASKIVAKRNVLKRFERIDLLRERGKWKEGDRATSLPKTKSA